MNEYKTRISSKGQIVIPKEIRERCGFKKGVEVVIKPVSETKLIIERVPRLSELFGVFEEVKITEVLSKERERESKIEEERFRELSEEF